MKQDLNKNYYLKSGTKLAVRQEQVDIVRPNKILSQTNDGVHQRNFTAVVGRVFSN